jgi:hypothetical protein
MRPQQKLVKRFRCKYPAEEAKMATVLEKVKKRRVQELATSSSSTVSAVNTDVLTEADFNAKLAALEEKKIDLDKQKSTLFQQLRSALTSSQTPAGGQGAAHQGISQAEEMEARR